MADIAEREIDATDLAAEVAALAGSGRVRAHYSAGDRMLKLHDTRRILSIGVTNSDAARRPPDERDAFIAQVAQAGAAWLRRRALLAPATLISIGLIREIDLRLISWTWSVGGRAFWTDAEGTLTGTAPG